MNTGVHVVVHCNWLPIQCELHVPDTIFPTTGSIFLLFLVVETEQRAYLAAYWLGQDDQADTEPLQRSDRVSKATATRKHKGQISRATCWPEGELDGAAKCSSSRQAHEAHT